MKVEFTEAAIKEYLDNEIRRWREAKKKSHTKLSETIAESYIAALQGVRVSLFEERFRA